LNWQTLLHTCFIIAHSEERSFRVGECVSVQGVSQGAPSILHTLEDCREGLVSMLQSLPEPAAYPTTATAAAIYRLART
jgi:hypothetical protein